jgi:purine-binding chemotaxis protein CheW
LDIILARDMLSFVPVADQNALQTSFQEKLKNRGILIVGRNERLSDHEWQRVGKDPIAAFEQA